jgi:3-phosphoshikimate 1-carboxyvinyltransferase
MKPVDTIFVGPARSLKGDFTVPGDKSISHRAVMFGALADGTTEINGLLEGEDNLSTIAAFRAMGIEMDGPSNGRLVVRGNGMAGLTEPVNVIDAANSGTTARLLTGLLSAQPFFSVLTGDASLRSRPMKRVVEPLQRMGAVIAGRKGATLLPLAISGKKLKGIEYAMPIASAQLKSALLLAGLFADGAVTVEEPLKSRDHTERMLKLFGAQVEINGNRVMVKEAKNLRACRIDVPGDISSAAFFMVAGSIVENSELFIRNVGVNPTRRGIMDILKKMGADVSIRNESDAFEPVADVVVKSSKLKAVEVNHEELLPAIDEFPIICIAALFAEGRTTITGAGELRVKESDRIRAMADLITALGGKAEELNDGLTIDGIGARGMLKGGKAQSLGDHRIAMSAAIAALRSEEGVAIEGAGAVDVSFPGFFNTLDRARA